MRARGARVTFHGALFPRSHRSDQQKEAAPLKRHPRRPLPLVPPSFLCLPRFFCSSDPRRPSLIVFTGEKILPGLIASERACYAPRIHPPHFHHSVGFSSIFKVSNELWMMHGLAGLEFVRRLEIQSRKYLNKISIRRPFMCENSRISDHFFRLIREFFPVIYIVYNLFLKNAVSLLTLFKNNDWVLYDLRSADHTIYMYV